MDRAIVLGIGNLLLADDGVGVHTVQALQERGALPHVDLVDAGTSTVDMLDLFTAGEKVIVIDAIHGGHEPGTIYRLPLDAIDVRQPANVSIHDAQLLEVVAMARMLGSEPDIVVLGVEPEVIRPSLELSATVAAAIPRLVEAIEHEVRDGCGQATAHERKEETR